MFLKQGDRVGQVQCSIYVVIIHQEENQSPVGRRPQRGQDFSDISNLEKGHSISKVRGI